VTQGVVIDVRDLSHAYMPGTPLEVQSLRRVNFRVCRNETVGIVGPTGSGKSTLLYHLNGLLRPQKGEVVVGGIELSNRSADVRRVRSMVGLVFQNPEDQLFEQYAGDDVAFGPRNYDLSKEEIRERVRKALEMVGLPFSFKDRLTADLSLGEKRRVALAGVFALEPEVLVIDEPTASLDPGGRRELIEVLKQWRKAPRRAMVIVSHSMEDILELADRTCVLAEGRMVYSGGTGDLFLDRNLLQAHDLVPPVSLQVVYGLEDRGFILQGKFPGKSLLTTREVAEAVGGMLHGQGF